MAFQRSNNHYRNERNQPNRPRRAPIPEGFSLFYISIECPPEINLQVESFKEHMERKYGCRAARKSPAHITIVPPFRAEDELQNELSGFITTFNIGLVPFNISLKNYGQFGERVLYIDVESPFPSLLSLESECMTEFSNKFPGIIFGLKPEFNPHVTIATRDIPEGALGEAKQYFEVNHPIEVSFEASAISLFKLNKGWWNKVS